MSFTELLNTSPNFSLNTYLEDAPFPFQLLENNLIDAIERHDLEAVKEDLPKIEDSTIRKNALITASQLGHLDIVLVLLDAGIPIDPTISLELLFYKAIQLGLNESLAPFLDYIEKHQLEFDINCRQGEHNETFLDLANRSGLPELAEWLKTKGSRSSTGDSSFDYPSKPISDRSHPLSAAALFHQLYDDVFFDFSPRDSAACSSSTPVSLVQQEQNSLNEKLLNACLEGDAKSAENYLNLGADIDAVNSDRCTPLHLAAASGNKQIVSLLIFHGCKKKLPFNINAQNGTNHQTALHIASENGHSEIFQILLTAGASLEIYDINENSPVEIAKNQTIRDLIQKQYHLDLQLQKACKRANIPAIKHLLECGANINSSSPYNRHPLYQAVNSGKIEVVQFVIDYARKKGIVLDINIKCEETQLTALHLACQGGQLDIVKLLLANGADINANNDKGVLPLHWAVAADSKEIVQFLIDYAREKGIVLDLNAKYGPSQSTALHLACRSGSSDIARILLDNGASKTERNKSDFTPFEVALNQEVKMLFTEHNSKTPTPSTITTTDQFSNEIRNSLEQRADVNQSDQTALRSLYRAINVDDKEHVERLIKHAREKNIPLGINVKSKDQENTPFHSACRRGNIPIIRILLENGASTKVLNGSGKTPFEVAITDEIKMILLEHNLKTIRTFSSSTPFEVVKQTLSLTPGEEKEIVKFLTRACRNGDLDKIRISLDIGVNLNWRNYRKWTPLYEAVYANRLESVQLIVEYAREKNIPLNIDDRCGHLNETPLHFACREGYLPIVKLLLDNGASTNALNKYGKSPSDVAKTDEIKALFEEQVSHQRETSWEKRAHQEIADSMRTNPSKRQRSYLREESMGLNLEHQPTLFVPRPAGFGNGANNCWCNALLQMVVSVPSLRHAYEMFACYYSPAPQLTSSSAASSSYDPQARYREALLQALESYDTASAIGESVPASISQGVRDALSHFFPGTISPSAANSEDASEALNWILSGYKQVLEKGLVGETTDPLFTPIVTSRAYTPIGPSYPADPMKLIRTRNGGDDYTPVPENNTSSQTQLWPEIRLPIENTDGMDFNTLLQRFFQSPGMGDETAQYLTPSNTLQTFALVETRNQFQTAPVEFLLNLERFGKLPDHTAYKIDRPLNVPLMLTLPANAIAESLSSPAVYTLDSFIIHTTNHYITYKKIDENWYECNDTFVEQIPQSEIETILNGGQTTYVHHYCRV